MAINAILESADCEYFEPHRVFSFKGTQPYFGEVEFYDSVILLLAGQNLTLFHKGDYFLQDFDIELKRYLTNDSEMYEIQRLNLWSK